MDGFKGDTIPYTNYRKIWVLNSFIPLERLCCTFIISFDIIIFTYQADIGSRIWYLCQEGRGWKKEWIIWGVGVGVLNLPSSPGIITDSIISSPDKAGVFPSFSEETTFITPSVPSPSSDKFYMASSLPSIHLTHFPWTIPLTPLLLKV